MFRHSSIYNYFISATVIFLYSCAQIVTPTGGERDILPPQLISVYPDNQTTNFQEKKITFYFNEYIALKDISNQLIVSPPFNNQPETVVKGKKLTMKLNDTLKANTTYNIQFGNSIADITEGNLSSNIQYAFSTGKEIDTLYVSGKLQMSNQTAVEKDVFVMIYGKEKFEADSLASKITPDYFCKADPSGNYKISNIKKGKYKIVALKDLNSNYKYDSHEEFIGFVDSIIEIEKSIENFSLSIFKADPFVQFIKTELKGEFLKTGVVFNKPYSNPSINFIAPKLEKETDYFTEKGRFNDTLFIYFNKIFNQDTLTYEVLDNAEIIDTIYFQNIKFNQIKKFKGQKEPKPFTAKCNTSAYQLMNEKNVALEFNYPVVSVDNSKILIVNNKDTAKLDLKKNLSSLRKYQSNYQFAEDSSYHILIFPAAFKSIHEKLINDTLNYKFKYPKYEEAGKFEINIKLKNKLNNYIVDLKNDKKELIKSVYCTENSKIDFGYLPSGSYFLEAIEDLNQNKIYDTGNYFKKIQPEKIFKYSKSISVKPGWEIEEEWILEN